MITENDLRALAVAQGKHIMAVAKELYPALRFLPGEKLNEQQQKLTDALYESAKVFYRMRHPDMRGEHDDSESYFGNLENRGAKY